MDRSARAQCSRNLQPSLAPMKLANRVDGLSTDGARVTVAMKPLGATEAGALVARLSMDDHAVRLRVHADDALRGAQGSVLRRGLPRPGPRGVGDVGLVLR